MGAMHQEIEWLLSEKYHGQKTAGFLADRARLKAGEPLAYIIGHIPFLNCTIHLDSRPLIPRPETEYWVAQAIESISNIEQAKIRVLDLCAGSGCIGVAVAKALPTATVDFAEIDPAHHATIKKNLTTNPPTNDNNDPIIIDDNRSIYGGDLFVEISAQEQYDYILSNPPYIDPALDRAEPSVKGFEPHRALYGGVNGLVVIKRLIADAPAYLKQNGELWIEHEPEQTADIAQLASSAGFLVTTHHDQYNVERFSQLTLR